uniref:Uncharacterized protein n=1 Tax=Marmota marmota marmota TaxID=9994 RepID=A0A8C5YTL4_MARMA
IDVNGKFMGDGKEVLEYLGDPANYPVSIRFSRPRLTSNEKLMLASMFHSFIYGGGRPMNAIIKHSFDQKKKKKKNSIEKVQVCLHHCPLTLLNHLSPFQLTIVA